MPQPQVVEKTEHSPAVVKSGQKLVISGLTLPADSNILFAVERKNNQAVEFRAPQARLTADTVTALEEIYEGRRKPPATLEQIEYLIGPDEVEVDPYLGAKSAEETASCQTSVTVVAIDGKLPREIHLQQPEEGSPTFQALDISVIGADLEVLINQSQPDSKEPEGNPWAIGCKRALEIGEDWQSFNHGVFNLSFVVPANTSFRLDFHALGQTPTLHLSEGLFEPLLLGLRARTVKIIPHNVNGGASGEPPALSVEANGDPRSLDINSIKAANEELRLNFSGTGIIEVNGKAAKTWSLIDLFIQYPTMAAIFTIMNGALAAWIIQNMRSTKRAD